MVIRLRGALFAAFVGVALILAPLHANADPQNGWWWNPDEGGRGFFIEMNGGVIYLAGYFYDADGRATWLSSGGPITDPYSYTGTLQSYRGGQTVFGAYKPPQPAVDVGSVTLAFSDDTHGTLTWPGGTVPIERHVFGSVESSEAYDPLLFVEPPFQPKTGWWWNPAQSGTGYSIEVQGTHAFVVAFMYDESGNPIWYFAAGPMSTPTHFEAEWLEFAGGQTLAGPYHPPATPRNLGRVTIDFTAFDRATIEFTGNAAARRGKFVTASRNGSASRTAKASPPKRPNPAVPQLPTSTWSKPGDYWPEFFCIVKYEFWYDDGVYLEQTKVGAPLSLKLTSDYRYTVDDSLGISRFIYEWHSVDFSNKCKGTVDPSHSPNSMKGSLVVLPSLTFKARLYDNIGMDVSVKTDSCENVQSQPPDTLRHVDAFFEFGNAFDTVTIPRQGNPYIRHKKSYWESAFNGWVLDVSCTAYRN